MKESVTYTATDIERYHSGQLSAAEMHAMEKAALDDPFLADALEGYTHTKTPASDLASLKQKLQLRIEKEDDRKVFFMSSPWMKIAASIVVIAGAGWLFFRTADTTTKANDVAANKENSSYKMEVPPSVAEDSTAVVFNSPTQQDNVVAKDEVKAPEQFEQRQLQQKQAAPVTSTPSVLAPSTNTLQEVRVEPFAKSFSLKVDSTKDVAFSNATKESVGRMKTTDTLRHIDVVLQSTSVAPEEEFVVTKKKESPSTSRRMQMKVDTLEPAEGWTRYDDYIADNLKTPDELRIKPINGFVELSFDVNKDGEPVNIAVTRSLCDKCDEEAIRLLKEGPKWKQKSKKGKIKIKF